ncbi:MAG: Nuclear control of ATPase protein 2 [Claussenomyces sp. TS43310]|nr:MAG: Nuclear control of ATPase protein 2 [Claussenomyces sp. TS43310]
MSIVADQVRRVDSQLDRLQLGPVKSAASSPRLTTADAAPPSPEIPSSPRLEELQNAVRALSTTSSSNPLLSSGRILALLEQADLQDASITSEADEKSSYETDLEWLLISKATVQTYGLILNTLLEQTIPLSNDIWYWDEVLGSYTYTGLYTIQTSPLRFWDWTKDIYRDSRRRLARLRDAPQDSLSTRSIGTSLTAQWRQFYGLVQESIRDRSVADIQRRVLSPIALCRTEAKMKQAGLRRLREMSASGLGVLMDEGLSFDVDEDVEGQVKTRMGDIHEWKGIVERSVALMDTVLKNVTTLETGVGDFEDAVFATVEDDPEISSRGTSLSRSERPARLSKRLQHILLTHVPNHVAASDRLASKYGRPSRLVRYWLPATTLLLSSTTILRIAVSRQADIVTWIRDFGVTVRDFWLNWVIEPTRKVIGTIRHDKDSEVAIMSKESLKGDRDSLERMVVDFAIENPEAANYGSGPLSETHISEIRAKVKEGDLTPVLRAYEKDLRSPLMGTVRGDLVRTLLIQVQKTKVDVEVAISGIDSLLKSQELVFGFVGLTPGVLVCIGVLRYLGGVFGSRKGHRKGRQAGQSVRVLRNIDRILSLSTPSTNGMLSYKDHGLLLCEVHVLRRHAEKLFPGEIRREFLEDVNELADIRIGIDRQLQVVQRIRWAYARWLAK